MTRDTIIELREVNPVTTRCRSCGALVRWGTTIAGKPMILNANAGVPQRGIDGKLSVPASATHWATCPNAKQHKKGGAM